MHFLCLERRETDKNVLKFSKNLVLKFHFLLLVTLLKLTITYFTVVVSAFQFLIFSDVDSVDELSTAIQYDLAF